VVARPQWRAEVVTIKMDFEAPPGTWIAENDYHARLAANTTISQLQGTLSSHAATTLRLEFPPLGAPSASKFAVEPFPDPSYHKAFLKRLEHIPGFWCCRLPNGPKGKGGTPYNAMIMGKGIEHRQ
jgi:hypothetical protein